MKILTLMWKIFPPNSKTAQLKQIESINLVANFLLYFIGTRTIDVFTSYASLYNLVQCVTIQFLISFLNIVTRTLLSF